jgi:putative redox protein
MSFSGSADTGFVVPLGTDQELGGDIDGFKPLELIAIGLAGCTAMDVLSILKKKRQEVSEFQVNVDATRADDHPRVFTAVHINYVIRGNNISEVAVQRAIELSETKYCPAQAMIGKVVPIQLSYSIG